MIWTAQTCLIFSFLGWHEIRIVYSFPLSSLLCHLSPMATFPGPLEFALVPFLPSLDAHWAYLFFNLVDFQNVFIAVSCTLGSVLAASSQCWNVPLLLSLCWKISPFVFYLTPDLPDSWFFGGVGGQVREHPLTLNLRNISILFVFSVWIQNYFKIKRLNPPTTNAAISHQIEFNWILSCFVLLNEFLLNNWPELNWLVQTSGFTQTCRIPPAKPQSSQEIVTQASSPSPAQKTWPDFLTHLSEPHSLSPVAPEGVLGETSVSRWLSHAHLNHRNLGNGHNPIYRLEMVKQS